MKFFAARWKRWTFVLVTLAVVLPGGYWGARHWVWPAVKSWRVERMNKVAREFLARGDDANALLTARKILQTSIDNLEAWRIAVAAAKMRQTSEIVFYQQNLARHDPTKANYLELIRVALRYDAVRIANEGIDAIAKKASDDPEFHALAAQFYQRTGRFVAAKFHLIALTQLKPSDREAQFDLAVLEIAEDPGRKDLALRARVRAMADDPALRVRALTLLLRESIKARLVVETRELVARLNALPDLSVSDRLLLLEGATLLDGPSLPLLEKLQAEVADKPRDLVAVMDYLARTGQNAKTIAWFGTLPEESKKDENVRRAVADAFLAERNWAALEGHLKSTVWPNLEFLRHALLAYTYRVQGRVVDFNEAWKTAVAAIGTDQRISPIKIRMLMARVDEWKWAEERYDLIWKLFAITPGNTAVQQALIAWEKRFGRTANMNKIFARIAEVEPNDFLAQNNLAYTSLLLDSNIARASLLARQLTGAVPKSPFAATTYAFSLYKQGDAAGALAKLETLTPTELSTPERGLLRAVILARLGQSDRATEMMKGVNMNRLLPEERRLGEGALAEIRRNARTQDDKTRLGSMVQTATGEASGWLALVARETRAAASVDMRLTDPLYVAADWKALQSALRTADWKSENYLRLALLSYTYRTQENLLESRDLWKQALLATERNSVRADNLKTLAAHWQWMPERLDALNLMFERAPTDRVMLEELVKQYRDTKRTRELMRVLALYVGRTSETSDEAVALAYYGLLLDENTSRARVLAKSAFEAAPTDGTRRLVFAFSLYKQRRAAEAAALLADLKGGVDSELVSLPLLRAAIDADLGMTEEVKDNLALFGTEDALPEEIAFAEKIKAQLSKPLDARSK